MKNFRLTSLLSLLAVAIAFETHAAEPPTPKETFTDEATGLTWTRCYYGTKITASLTNEEIPKLREECVGKPIEASWFAATNIARDAEIDGKKGWRLPTRKEWDDLLNRKTVSKSQAMQMFPFSSSDCSAWAGDRDVFLMKAFKVEFRADMDNGNAMAKFKNSVEDGERSIFVLDGNPEVTAINKPKYEIKASRFFDDPATGMTWVPSLVSESYTTVHGQKRDYGTYNFNEDANYANGNKEKINGDCPPRKYGGEYQEPCTKSHISLSWWEAVVFSQDLTLNGITGWRLPTRAELEAILPKLDTAGYPYAHEFLSNCFTTDLGKKAGTVVSYEHYRRKAPTRGFEEVSASDNGNVCLIRGSSQEPHYAKLVERALAWKGESDFPIIAHQATFSAELAAKEAEEGRKYLLGKTDRQLADAAARQKKEQQQKDRLLAFRSNLKPGDRTREGLVLQTKGELVLVQHQEQICVVTNSHGGCNQWRPRQTGNQVWVRRNELNLP